LIAIPKADFRTRVLKGPSALNGLEGMHDIRNALNDRHHTGNSDYRVDAQNCQY
jgi:hypothetical protein